MNNLRERALSFLKEKNTSSESMDDLKVLLHELDVYQAELEIQNQDLLEKESMLIQSKEELSILFMNAPLAYIVLDDKFNITKYNLKASNIFNFKSNKKVHFYSYIKELSNISDFLDWLKVKDRTFKIDIKDGNGNCKSLELEHVQSDFNGQDIHLISAVDITENLLKERKLTIFNSILNQLPVCIVITDENAKITYVNEELIKSSGYKSSELIGKSPSMFKSGFTSDLEYKNLWMTISSGRTWHGVFKNIMKNNSIQWMATAITPIFDEDENIINYISVETNINEKIAMENTLKKQEEIMLLQSRHASMGQMISMIAHQWRQPLSAISSIASGIKVKYDLDVLNLEKDLKDLDEIVNITQYLSQTIDDFRNFYKKDKEVTNLTAEEILEKLIFLTKSALASNEINLILRNNTEKKIYTYLNEIIQVLINLVNNSKDALLKVDSANREIIIDVINYKDGFKFIVSDNGGGIDEEIVDLIFDPYFTTKDSLNGTGLGLHIVKTIVEQHLNGTIKVSNDNRGAVFTLLIPTIIDKK